ncbi:MAG: Eco57I restriction-modification methylase domain-containing protein, partial [Longimicrobiaceae bacterium]
MKPFENRSLFSDHYLDERLPDHPEWSEDVEGAWSELRALFARQRPQLEGMNEAQTEEEWVKPILSRVLGWSYSVQTDATLFGRRNRPDYALFPSEETKRAAQAAGADGRLDYSRAAAVGDAKFWGRPLDRELRDPRDRLTNTNPSFQIVNYLVATGVDWGILTNGREWRLYSMRARSRVDTYYAVDLQRILEAENLESFRYFYHFFRAAAFQSDPHSGRGFLDAVLERSVTYGAELEERLKRIIFDEVFEHLAAGFVAGRRERGRVETEETLREVYAGTLRLLYRLLFVLYAESRDLLPLRGGYARYSLTRIKREVAEWIDRGDPLSGVSNNFWNDLVALFRILERGDPELGVPQYNGSLFRSGSPQSGPVTGAAGERHRFLDEHGIADRYLLPALDRLTRAGERHFIDYKSLSVEQLGTIYEGLLEFRLRLAPHALAVVREKGVEVYRPAAEVEQPLRTIPAGRPYLENDKGERKVTGSYYTPQYIVEHIVEKAVGPVLREREQRFRARMEEIGPKRERLRELEAKLAAPGLTDAVATRWTREANALRGESKRLEAEAVDALLGLRICDPAMGSGHFLVHTVDWLTERLMVVLNEYPANPVLAQLAEIRAEILETLAQQGIRIDPAVLKDTHLLKRLVMKRCIYGVDLNPMATELAKLALWLDSFTIGAPLSFLDHHLKTGNSLVGTRVDEMRRAVESTDTGQYDAFGGPFAGLLRATALMRDVATTTDATFQEVSHSAERYAEFERAMLPYRRLLDLWVSRHFGNRSAVEEAEGGRDRHRKDYVTAEELALLHWNRVLAEGRGEPVEFRTLEREVLDRAATLFREHRFFHWDLEFPEVFVDLERATWKEDPGFDAVIGNPPYVRQEQISAYKPFLRASFAAFHGVADLYLYFYEQGIRLLCEGGRLAFISSGTFARANFAGPFREMLPRLARLESVIDFGENQPFAGAEMVRPSILVLRKGEEEGPFRTLFIDGRIPASLTDALAEHGFDSDPAALRLPEWTFQPAAHTRVFEKLLRGGRPLAEVVEGRMYYGVKTGLNEAFIIDQTTRDHLVAEHAASAEIIKPVLRGEDLRPWYQEDEGRWLIVLPHGWTSRRFGNGLSEDEAWQRLSEHLPAIAAYLAPFAAAGRKRTDQGEFWWELRPCDYYDAFEQTKIFWPDIAKLPRFSWDEEGKYINDKGFIIPDADPSLLGILQSRVTWFGVSQMCVPLRLRAGLWQYQMKSQFISRLPIPDPPPAERERIGALATEITTRARERYTLHRRVRHRIASDLGAGRPLNRRLTDWWTLDFPAFRAEVKKALKREIPVRERDEWEA